MRNIWTVCRRELYSYFVSPIAWVLLAIFALLSGYFTYLITGYFVQASLQSQMSGQPMPMNLNEQVITPLFSNIAVIGLFLIPLITMRLFAEEKRQGTIELLATSPIHDLEIVMGKWLSAVLMYCALLLVLLIDYSFLFLYGQPDWKPVVTGFLGVLLEGGCLLALGTFISTTTKNQIIAGAVGFSLALLLWILNWTTSFGNSPTVQVLGYLSILSHLDSFSRGVIDSKDVIYYLSLIFLGLFLTTRSLESLRWRA
ncbi:MAG: ABC transporter permease subunit [Acidobacteriaceae bacterium]|nr:ABC transporter permease subunit [Acidobacteriaceae bacterium]MBV9778825.1 ABC transporter permease subunit [Acidobacteriaceae bacterium]